MSDIEDPTATALPSQSGRVSCSASPGVAGSAPRESKARLGDFSKLRLGAFSSTSTSSICTNSAPSSSASQARSSHDAHHSSDSNADSNETGSVQYNPNSSLGNFTKILSSLRRADSPAAPTASAQPTSTPTDDMTVTQYTAKQLRAILSKSRSPNPFLSPAGQKAIEDGYTSLLRDSSHEMKDPSSSSSDDSDSPSTPATSICGSPAKHSPSAHGWGHESATSKSRMVPLRYGLPRDMQHENLLKKLVGQKAIDHATRIQHPTTAENGIYIFLDTSNIEISFRNAVKDRMGVDRDTLITPLPGLDIEFLTKILVRDRPIKAMRAGCSYRPGRAMPRILEELGKFEYDVDLRERKLLQDGPASSERKAGRSGRGNTSDDAVHYVEDLVDETLQTRIGESVMQNFKKPGTIVLATGDGKAAKFSDGFFAYADRALEMGWNVEVISWGLSLSSVWTDPEWTKRWGSRFRVIYLDLFMDELYPSSSNSRF